MPGHHHRRGGLGQKLVGALENRLHVDLDGDGIIGNGNAGRPHRPHHHQASPQIPMGMGLAVNGANGMNGMIGMNGMDGMINGVNVNVMNNPVLPYNGANGFGNSGGAVAPYGMGGISNNINGVLMQQNGGYGGAANSPQMGGMGIQHFGGGNRKALLIGINYTGTRNQLKGCVNDVRSVQQFLLQSGWPQNSMTILVDDRSWGTPLPTRKNITEAVQRFAASARPGDQLFFHYSGHGGKVRDASGDEADGFDETICPLDFNTAGQIVDDELFARLVAPLPAGCRMFALMDCCNSGTGLDLPYRFIGNDRAMKNAFNGGGMYRHNKHGALGNVFGMLGGAKHSQNGGFAVESHNIVNADVVCIGACNDRATSADLAGPNGMSAGACTTAFLNTFKTNHTPTYMNLMESIRQEVRMRRLPQQAQISAGRPIDMSQPVRL